MSRPRLIALFIALLLALGVYWYFSPYLTLHAMRSAAQARDTQALARHVDFPKVRDSLKRQLHAKTKDTLARAAGGGELARAGAELGARLANVFTDAAVNVLISPERLADAMDEGKMRDIAPDDSPVETAAGGKQKQWAFERRSLDVVVAKALDGKGEPDIGFVLAHEGFATWRLVGIELPRSWPRPADAE
ncbi:DUF2939 domain-containing protein [Massilia sp. METH4]|uniref:DUF2939 domain-containing protein n=1 Tax=Massilia sp. METH4 TaxID=3123041 RepID=UPI0030CDBD17